MGQITELRLSCYLVYQVTRQPQFRDLNHMLITICDYYMINIVGIYSIPNVDNPKRQQPEETDDQMICSVMRTIRINKMVQGNAWLNLSLWYLFSNLCKNRSFVPQWFIIPSLYSFLSHDVIFSLCTVYTHISYSHTSLLSHVIFLCIWPCVILPYLKLIFYIRTKQ